MSIKKNQPITIQKTYYAITVGQGLFYASFSLSFFALPLLIKNSFDLPHNEVFVLPFIGILIASLLTKIDSLQKYKAAKQKQALSKTTSKFLILRTVIIFSCYSLTSIYAMLVCYEDTATRNCLLLAVTLCSGIGAGFLLIDWHALSQKESANPFIHEISVTIIGLFFTIGAFGIFYLSSYSFTLPTLSLFYIFASMFLFILNKKNASRDTQQHNNRKLEKAKKLLDKRIRVIFLVFQILFGMAWSILLLRFNLQGNFIAYILGFLLAFVAFLIIYKSKFTHANSVMLFIRVSLSLLIILAFLLVVKNDIFRMIVVALIAALWNIFWSFDMGFIVRQAKMLDLSIKKHICTSQTINNLGFATGMSLGTFADFDACFVFGLWLIIVSALFIPLDSHKSPDSIFAQQEKQQKINERNKQERAQGIEKTIQDFSKRYQLTFREDEVLRQIIHGRSPKSIAKELHIAESTAKTHVYNLYKKLNIHTRYELIELFDSFTSVET